MVDAVLKRLSRRFDAMDAVGDGPRSRLKKCCGRCCCIASIRFAGSAC